MDSTDKITLTAEARSPDIKNQTKIQAARQQKAMGVQAKKEKGREEDEESDK